MIESRCFSREKTRLVSLQRHRARINIFQFCPSQPKKAVQLSSVSSSASQRKKEKFVLPVELNSLGAVLSAAQAIFIAFCSSIYGNQT
jgi:hypothetical protein